MPLFLDIHSVEGVTPEDAARAHNADLDVQVEYGVEYLKYWLDEESGKVFCLCHAPNAEAATEVHRVAHGMAAERVIEVDAEHVEQLLGDGKVDDAGAVLVPGKGEHDTAVRTVLFTDIVGSTALTQELGDQAAVEMVVIHDQIVGTAINMFDGRMIKHTGDGIMACFTSAPAAVGCAMEIQKGIARYAETGKYPLEVRIGAAAGHPIDRNNDLFGSTVQLAARLCGHAEPSQALVASSVATLCPDMPLSLVGEVALKGFPEPVALHAIDWRGEG